MATPCIQRRLIAEIVSFPAAIYRVFTFAFSANPATVSFIPHYHPPPLPLVLIASHGMAVSYRLASSILPECGREDWRFFFGLGPGGILSRVVQGAVYKVTDGIGAS